MKKRNYAQAASNTYEVNLHTEFYIRLIIKDLKIQPTRWIANLRGLGNQIQLFASNPFIVSTQYIL